MDTALLSLDLHSIEKLREQELEEARVIQNVMMPAHPLCHAGVTISHEFQPVMEVGGDYLDYFKLSDETIGLYVGDVSGKGLPAALYAALAVGTLRGFHKTGMEPERVLSLLNQRLLLRGIPGRHSAIQYALARGSALSALECLALFCSPAQIRASSRLPDRRRAYSPQRATTSSCWNWNLVILSCFSQMVSATLAISMTRSLESMASRTSAAATPANRPSIS
jgi:hypothetical protein